MQHRFAIFHCTALFCAFMIGVSACAVVPTLSAQTLSQDTSRPVDKADRIATDADYGPLVPLHQTLPSWAKQTNENGFQAADLNQRLRISILLRRGPASESAFSDLLAHQQDPASPLYHQWLTPQQVGVLYGPSSNDLAAITSWLTSQGLAVDSVSPDGLIVRASGSLATVGGAFHTSFGLLTDRARTRLSAVSEPYIPAALSEVIQSVDGLTQTRYEPQSRLSVQTRRAPDVSPQVDLGGSSYAVLPNDFSAIYDLGGVYATGNQGGTIGSKAQRIAIIGKSRVVASDIANYETLAGLPSIQPTVVLAGTDPGVATGSNMGYASEATLDVDRVIGTAPAAQVDLVISADTTTDDGVDIGIGYNIDTLRDPIMSISFGSCEAQNGSAETDYLDSRFKTAASEGISTFVSSDDSGVAGCDTPFTGITSAEIPQIASINVLCSSGYVTCVGGTEFNDSASPSLYWASQNASNGYESALGYIPEGAWNESSTVSGTGGVMVYQVAAGGGGSSAYIAKPSWQSGLGVPADGFRDVPDISFTAADHDGYLACFAAGGGSCISSANGTQITIFSGTSAAAPGMAGIAALLNTKMGSAQGNLNPLLYRLATSTPSAFHDVTVASSGVSPCTAAVPSMCNNSTPGQLSLSGGLAGYLVGTGYDKATGLGSLDVANFITAVAASGAGGTAGMGSFSLVANPATLSVTPVANTTTTSTWTLTATSADGFAGSVALSCSVSTVTQQPPTCAVTPGSVSLSAGRTGIATISMTSEGAYSSCLTNAATGRAGAAAAGLMLLLLPLWKRRAARNLTLMLLMGLGLGMIDGCGGASTAIPCSNVVSPGTTPGTYTVMVTGTSGSLSNSTTFTVTVN